MSALVHCRLVGVPDLPVPKPGLEPRTPSGQAFWAIGKGLLVLVAVIVGSYALLVGLAFAACGVCH